MIVTKPSPANAICPACGQEMGGKSCTVAEYQIAGQDYARLPYGGPHDGWIREEIGELAATCWDCGTPLGALHHPCCDRERCPRCLGQVLSCACPI
jgi:hypothetical protein